MATPKTWSERFSAHLEKRGITDVQACHELKVGQSQIHYWTHGSTPREKRRKQIERWSGGEVPSEADEPARKAG